MRVQKLALAGLLRITSAKNVIKLHIGFMCRCVRVGVLGNINFVHTQPRPRFTVAATWTVDAVVAAVVVVVWLIDCAYPSHILVTYGTGFFSCRCCVYGT